MKIDAELVLELRSEKAWSQEELGIAAGLNLRTIQRIEKEATISLQSKKALASAFEELPTMKKYEYKSVVLKFDIGWSKSASIGPFEFDNALNEYAKEGWRLNQLIQGTTVHGGSGQAIVFLEREIMV